MQNCDVLIAIGARFDDRVIGNPEHFFRADRKIIHIDIDPSSISKRGAASTCRSSATSPTCWTRSCASSSPRRSAPTRGAEGLVAEIKEWQRKDCLRYDRKSELIKPQFVIEKSTR